MDIIKIIYSRMKRKKLLISREIGPFNRIYNTSDAFIWCAGSLLGYQCYYFPLHLKTYGDGGMHSYLFCGIILSINVWCCMELTAVHPCLGGPYHYVYHYSGEFMGFIVGWFTILGGGLGVAYQLKSASRMLDQTFFNGDMAKGIKWHINFGKTLPFEEFPDLLSLLLSLIFSGIVSADTNETKLLNVTLFFLNMCCVICLSILFFGFMDFDNWIHFQTDHIVVIFDSFILSSAIYHPIFCLSFLGEEAINPAQTLPKAQAFAFLFGLVVFTVFSILTTLVWPYQEVDHHNPINSILVHLKVEGLTFIPMIGVTCFIYTSIFLYMMSLIRVVCAMARDGLLHRVLSRVEHFNNMPVKPSFICGFVTGIVAVFMHRTSLSKVASITLLIVCSFAPICIMKMRYLSSIDHLQGKIVRKNNGKVPSHISSLIVTLLVTSVIIVSITCSDIYIRGSSATWVTWRVVPITLFGITSIFSFVFLLIQPQNHTVSPFRVRLVPLLPTVNLFFIAYSSGFITKSQWIFIFLWLVSGSIFYLSYSMWHSKEEV